MTDAARFERPWLLLCEGVGDERFFTRLIETRAIDDDFIIRRPVRDGAGRTNFGRELNSVSVAQSFIDNVKGILVVSDSDDDPAASFAEVQEQIRSATGFAVPDHAGIVARSADQPPVVILMIPIGQSGNLESICLESVYAKWGLRAHLDTFVANSPAGAWPYGKQAKMRMQTMLASNNKRQPDAGFASSWNQPHEYRIPVDHACFKDIVDFLKNFPAMVSA